MGSATTPGALPPLRPHADGQIQHGKYVGSGAQYSDDRERRIKGLGRENQKALPPGEKTKATTETENKHQRLEFYSTEASRFSC